MEILFFILIIAVLALKGGSKCSRGGVVVKRYPKGFMHPKRPKIAPAPQKQKKSSS